MKKTVFLFLSLVASLSLSAAKTLTSEALKLVPDGKTLNTVALQQAIDQLSKKGGGCISLSEGKYLTGAIQLKSGVELHLERGAVLLGSTNPDDYYQLQVMGDGDVVRKDNSKYGLILAQGAKAIKLTGEGVIDGQGQELALTIDSLVKAGVKEDPNYSKRLRRPSEIMRPKLFFFSECDGVEITGLTLRNSACWGLSFDLCRNMLFQHLDVYNRAYWNNDGIDLTDCAYVRILDCHINAADDGVCLKSYHKNGISEHILVQNCEIRSSASAIKFGTATWGTFRNIEIRDNRVIDTFRSCIAIESVDGSKIDSVVVDGLKAWNTGNAIFIKLGNRAGNDGGHIRNVIIRNMDVELAFGRPDTNYDIRGPEVSYFHNPFPSSITGWPGHPVENVLLENIRISAPGRADKGMAYVKMAEVPENEDKYPEFTMFGELPAWAFFLRHVDGITLRNVQLTLRDRDFREPIAMEDVKGYKTEQLAIAMIQPRHNGPCMQGQPCGHGGQPRIHPYVREGKPACNNCPSKAEGCKKHEGGCKQATAGCKQAAAGACGQCKDGGKDCKKAAEGACKDCKKKTEGCCKKAEGCCAQGNAGCKQADKGCKQATAGCKQAAAGACGQCKQ